MFPEFLKERNILLHFLLLWKLLHSLEKNNILISEEHYKQRLGVINKVKEVAHQFSSYSVWNLLLKLEDNEYRELKFITCEK